MDQEQYSRTGASTPVLLGIVNNVFHICIGVFVLSTAYLLYGVFFGLGDFGSWDRARQVTMMGNINLAGNVMLAAAVLGSVCSLVLFWFEETAGYLMALLAGALYFGVPMAFASMGGEPSVAMRMTVARFPVAALAPALIAVILVVRDLIVRLIRSLDRQSKVASDLQFGNDAKREDRPVRMSLIGKCWEGAYCRDYIRTHCPIFKAKDTCWQRRRGCYCDEEIVNTATKKSRGTVLEMAPNEAQNYANSTPKKVVFLSDAQKVERCRNCIIYNEHQREKYKILLPVVMLLSVLLCAFLGYEMRDSVGNAMNTIESTIRRFAFTGDPTTAIKVAKPNETAIWAFVLAGSIMVIAKIIHALEWAIFEKKW
jgi:hypothetical protein